MSYFNHFYMINDINDFISPLPLFKNRYKFTSFPPKFLQIYFQSKYSSFVKNTTSKITKVSYILD